MIDLNHVITSLTIEKRKLTKMIAYLEELQRTPAEVPNLPVELEPVNLAMLSNRGRKSMNSAERLEVSERMKRYWANRREAKQLAAVN